MPSPQSPHSIAVIGGGITGLAAAVRIRELAPDAKLTLFESSNRLGGVLKTERRDDWLIEHSADNFLTKLPWGTDFCRKLGLEERLLPTDQARRKALVVSRGRVARVPEGFLLMSPRAVWPVLRSPVLSVRGKLRLCMEPFIPRRNKSGDQSVAEFAKRRVGREAFERLVQPLMAGIYTADPEKLSMLATMPQFVEQEQEYGSLLWAARRQKKSPSAESGARYGLFVAPSGGMQQLVEAAAAQLPPDTVCHQAVTSVQRQGDAWKVTTSQGERSFNAVVIATQAYAAAQMLKSGEPNLAKQLNSIEYAGASIVCFGFKKNQLPATPQGFGFVVPSVEKRSIIAASFSSLKFPGRAPDDAMLVRAFVGGALQPQLADLEDGELTQLALGELQSLLGIVGEPLFAQVARWPSRMPQYHVGHVERVEAIEQTVSRLPGLQLAGAAYRGVGVPQCIHSGEQAAERAAESLNKASMDETL